MDFKHAVFEKIVEVAGRDAAISIDDINDETPLIGDGSILDSMNLVELCLALEDLAADADATFDWTSEAAMSKSRSMFRTAGALAQEFIAQVEAA